MWISANKAKYDAYMFYMGIPENDGGYTTISGYVS